jgi:hypothetical protein
MRWKPQAVALHAHSCQFEEDPAIARMIFGWPTAFESARARRLGLSADPDFLSVIRQYQKEQAI